MSIQSLDITLPESRIYVLLGWVDGCVQETYEKRLFGAFSKMELAEKVGEVVMELGIVHSYMVLTTRLDELLMEGILKLKK